MRSIGLTLSLFFLVSCGDGGGSSADPDISDTDPADTDSADAVLSGNGQLGVIIGGIVSVQDVDGVELASDITGEDGNYGPVAIPGPSHRPLIVEITPAGDGSSSFVCDFASGCPDPNAG